MQDKPTEGVREVSKNGGTAGPVLVLATETGARIEVPLEDCGQGPGLGVVNVSVLGEKGNTIVPAHRYHFDVRRHETLDLNCYVEEPGELPNLPAFLQVEPYQQPGNKLVAASKRLADDLPRVCPECGGPLHLRLIQAQDLYYPVGPDGGIADAFEPGLTYRDDADGEVALVCVKDGCGWTTDFGIDILDQENGGPIVPSAKEGVPPNAETT